MSETRVETPAGALNARRWAGAGQGLAPLVLFHDSLGSVGLWRELPEALAAATGRDVIAWDRLGFGASDPHPGRLAPDFVATEATGGFAAIRRAFGLDRFVALGHSVGGGMALEAAAAFPEAAVAVVTISTQAAADEPVRAGIRIAEAAFAAPGQLERLARHHGDKAQWVLDSWTRTWLSPDFDGYSLDGALGRLACPLLVIHGAADEYGGPDHARHLARLGRGRLELLAGQGHFPHRADPERVVGLVADFLRDLP